MKTFALIWKNIRYYYRRSRPVFWLFTAGLLSASLLLIYLYGNLTPSVREYSTNDLYARKYTFSFPSDPSLQDMETLLNRYNETESFLCLFSAPITGYPGKGDRIYTVGCEIKSENNGIRRTRGRTYFTEEELAEGANVAIISESAEYHASGGTLRLGEDTIHVNGVDFTVIGTANFGCDILIPAASYTKNGFPIASVSVTMEKRPSYYENLELLRDMREQFPGVSVGGHPYSAYEHSKQDTPSVLLVLAIVFVAAISAFMFLLKYLSDGTNYISAIQSVCGAPKDTVVFIKLASVFLLTFSVSAAGVALHALLYEPLFSKLNIYEGLIYQPHDYLLVIAVCCAAVVLVSIPFLFSFTRDTAAAFKRRLE